jgi:hypothetical protein
MPGQGGGAVSFALASSAGQVGVGEYLTVTVMLSGTTAFAPDQLGGLGLTVRFDPHKLAVAQVNWTTTSSAMLPLGPTVDNAGGMLSLGVISLPVGTTTGAPLATITFIGQGVGTAQLEVTAAEAMNSAGQVISASAQTMDLISVAGQQMFLPLVDR